MKELKTTEEEIEAYTNDMLIYGNHYKYTDKDGKIYRVSPEEMFNNPTMR